MLSRICYVSCDWARLLSLIMFASLVRADDWPQWRGPQRDGVWRETGVIETIPPTGLPVKWHVRIFNGWSGPAVANGRVFLNDHNYKSDPEVERVVCFDAESGKQLWLYEYPCPYGNMEYGNGPRATPTVHAGLVYSLGTFGHLVCLNAETGNVVWKKDPAELKIEMPRYGVSASPLIEGDVVIVTTGARPRGTVMAFDRTTGTERWRALDDRPAYSSPILVDMAGKRQAIVWTGDNVNSFDPQTGELLWQVPYKAKFDPAQATTTPVVYKDKLLCLAAWNRGSLMLQLDQQKPAASIFWQTRTEPTSNSGTPVFHDERHIYAILGDGALACLDAATGDEIWRTRDATSIRFGMGHIVTHEDRSWIFNQQGHLIAAKLTPDGYREMGRMLLVEPTAGYRVGGAVAWSHPAFADKCVYARNDRELVCVSLAADAQERQPAALSQIESSVLEQTDDADAQQALSIAVAPDGATVAMASGWGIVRQIDLSARTVVPSVDRHNDWVCAVTYSADGKYLVSAGGSEFTPARNGGKTTGEIKVWDRLSRALKGKLEGHTNKIFAAVFSPDGKTLATGAADQTIRLWNVESLQEQRVLKGHTDAISSLAWSPDGTVLASASWDKTVRLWNPNSGEQLATLTGSDELLSVAVSPDGTLVAAGGANWLITLWNIGSRERIAELSGHRGTVYAMAFSPDAVTLATGSGDETVRLWNIESRETKHVLRGHRSGISSVAFTPDGARLVSGALNDPVRIWNLSVK